MVADGLTINPTAVQPVASTQVLSVPDAPDAVKQQPVTKEQPIPEPKPIDTDVLEKIAEELNEDFRIFNATISFSVDKDTGTTVVRIFDRDTEEVIRVIPPEELLSLAAKLTDIIGRLVDKKI
ncbi:MAG: flagellar protein FlaG [bacterium]|nr:flagellar protein FlaG [bacterium]